MDRISVVIPTFNRPNTIDLVLDTYFQQKGVAEVIVVDDGSTLSYASVLEKYRAQYPQIPLVYLKNNSNLGAGACRNIGINAASGDCILWGEDDAFLAPNYTEVLLSKMKGHQILFGSIYYGILPDMPPEISNPILVEQQQSPRPVFDYATLEGYYRKTQLPDTVVPFGHALLLVPRAAYDGVSYFEGYRVNGYREETDAQVQMTKNGYQIIYTTETQCYHFPSVNKKGGQHHAIRLRYEAYKIINNNLFLDRHYAFLRQTYQLPKSIGGFRRQFARHVVKGLWQGLVRRIGHLGNQKRN